MENNQRLIESQLYWDKEADSFDDEPDHGLRDPAVRAAWDELLKEWLPATAVSILDIGCGTGSLSLLMADQGYHVLGIDLSAAMLDLAKAKTQTEGYTIRFKQMDASAPELGGEQFDVLVCRHLLWALPETAVVLQRWANLLNPGGRLLLIEGFWHTGGGLHAEQIVSALPAAFTTVKVETLSKNAALWGTKMNDERYIVIADYLT